MFDKLSRIKWGSTEAVVAARSALMDVPKRKTPSLHL